MPRIELELDQIAEPLDPPSIAAVQIGLEQIARGETATLDQAKQNAERRYQERRKASNLRPSTQ